MYVKIVCILGYMRGRKVFMEENEKLFESLNTENRNAIPSWQGYHYQAQVAMFELLKCIHESCVQNMKMEDANIVLKLEWLEDFVILEGGKVCTVGQVKKTLTKKEHYIVLENFIFQFLIKDDKKCTWKLIFDEAYRNNCSMKKETIKERFEIVTEKYLGEIELLEANLNNFEFLKKNLDIRSSESGLPRLRHYIRKVLKEKGIELNGTNQEKLKYEIETYVLLLKSKLCYNENLIDEFLNQFKIVPIKKADLEQKIYEEIVRLKDCIEKNDALSEGNILKMIYAFIYNQIMRVNCKGIDEAIITINDIINIYRDKENQEYLNEEVLFDLKASFDEAIGKRCKSCQTNSDTDCKDCIMKNLSEVDIKDVTKHLSLEIPLPDGNFFKAIRNLYSDEKINYLVTFCFTYRKIKELQCSKDKRQIFAKNIFVSAVISDPNENLSLESDIREHALEHQEIYRDYDKIATKFFERSVTFDNIISKRNEMQMDKQLDFLSLPTVKFIKKDNFEESI